MQIKSIDEVRPGMVLADTVINSKGMKLLNKGTVLSKEAIATLRHSGIARLRIEDEEAVQQTDIRQVPQKIYDELVSLLHSIRFKILTEGKFQMPQVNRAVQKLMEHITDNPRPYTELLRLKHTAPSLAEHMVDVCFITAALAKEMQLTFFETRDILTGALLHDIGKFLVPENILKKTAPTDDEQFLIMKHTTLGQSILAETEDMHKPVMTIALQHHERLDGSGYPFGLTGENIDKLSLLVSVADTYANLIREQAAGTRLPDYEAAEYIWAQAGIKLDKQFVDLLMTSVISYPLQCLVKLNTGETGKVIFQNGQLPTRPVVKVGRQNLDLAKIPTLFIAELLSLDSYDPDQLV